MYFPIPGARFTNFSCNSNLMKILSCCNSVPLFLAIRSQQNVAHSTTAQLSCHVRNFVAISVSKSRWAWNKISIEFEFWWKIVSETGMFPQRLWAPQMSVGDIPHLVVWIVFVVRRLRKLPRATTNVQKNKSYVGLFISYVGLFISYVGLFKLLRRTFQSPN